MKTTDEALAAAAAAGDRDAFAVLLERRYDSIFRLVFRLTGSRVQAEDLTQEICASLPRKLSGFRGEARFSTWLYRVVVNATYDSRRRSKARRKATDGWGDWELNRRAALDENAQSLEWLLQAMTHLPQDQRDTLALVLDKEMTHAQAAQVLGVKEGTISWRVAEAKQALRNLAQQEKVT